MDGRVFKFRACHCFATYVAILGKHATENSSNCGYEAYELGGLRAGSNATCRTRQRAAGTQRRLPLLIGRRHRRSQLASFRCPPFPRFHHVIVSTTLRPTEVIADNIQPCAACHNLHMSTTEVPPKVAYLHSNLSPSFSIWLALLKKTTAIAQVTSVMKIRRLQTHYPTTLQVQWRSLYVGRNNPACRTSTAISPFKVCSRWQQGSVV